MQLINTYLLSSCYVTGPFLGAENLAIKKIKDLSYETNTPMGKTDKKQTDRWAMTTAIKVKAERGVRVIGLLFEQTLESTERWRLMNTGDNRFQAEGTARSKVGTHEK